MQYIGGKSRIAEQIAPILIDQARGGDACFISLFCGSCAVESKIRGYSRVICNDKHPYLIAMFKALQTGYLPPDSVSEAEYKFVRQNPDLYPALTGFVGFGCSFGGKFFGGYARNARADNYAARSKRSILKDMPALIGVEFMCADYKTVPIPENAVVYADPPYADTTGYGGEKFDSAEFWRYARLIAETGHRIYVSEQKAPEGWTCVWEKPFLRTLDRNKDNQFTVTEKLFTWGRMV